MLFVPMTKEEIAAIHAEDRRIEREARKRRKLKAAEAAKEINMEKPRRENYNTERGYNVALGKFNKKSSAVDDAVDDAAVTEPIQDVQAPTVKPGFINEDFEAAFEPIKHSLENQAILDWLSAQISTTREELRRLRDRFDYLTEQRHKLGG